MQAQIWLTGFEPFGVHDVNPSQQLVEKLLGTTFSTKLEAKSPYGFEDKNIAIEVFGKVLSVDEEGSQYSTDFISEVDAVIHVGLNENAENIRIEMCAVNENNFRISDNSGRHLIGELVDESGLPLLHTTIHRPSIENIFLETEYVEISEDCGRFVCNETYYRTLQSIEANSLQARGRALPAVFVHIPPFSHVSEDIQLSFLRQLSASIVQKPCIDVVGGVIHNSNGRILACQRSVSGVMGGYWEFPGGKVERGESLRDALIREICEELNHESNVGDLLGTIKHDYGSMIVNISFFSCRTEEKEFISTAHDECRWVSEDEAKSLDWLPADIDFINQLADKGFKSI